MEEGLIKYLDKCSKEVGRVFQLIPEEKSEEILSSKASRLAVDRLKTCVYATSCIEYMTDSLDLWSDWFGEKVVIAYCCETCHFYKRKT